MNIHSSAVFVLAACLLHAPVLAADVGFAPGQSLRTSDALARARETAVPDAAAVEAGRPADAPLAAAFLARLDGTYTGREGRLELAGEPYALEEARVIALQKLQDGFPAVLLRMTRRFSRDSNPAHIETLSSELTLIAKGSGLVVRRDLRADEPARIERAGADELSLTYRKGRGRWDRDADVLETWTFTLANGRLTARRRESGAVADIASEAFSVR